MIDGSMYWTDVDSLMRNAEGLAANGSYPTVNNVREWPEPNIVRWIVRIKRGSTQYNLFYIEIKLNPNTLKCISRKAVKYNYE